MHEKSEKGHRFDEAHWQTLKPWEKINEMIADMERLALELEKIALENDRKLEAAYAREEESPFSYAVNQGQIDEAKASHKRVEVVRATAQIWKNMP